MANKTLKSISIEGNIYDIPQEYSFSDSFKVENGKVSLSDKFFTIKTFYFPTTTVKYSANKEDTEVEIDISLAGYTPISAINISSGSRHVDVRTYTISLGGINTSKAKFLLQNNYTKDVVAVPSIRVGYIKWEV